MYIKQRKHSKKNDNDKGEEAPSLLVSVGFLVFVCGFAYWLIMFYDG